MLMHYRTLSELSDTIGPTLMHYTIGAIGHYRRAVRKWAFLPTGCSQSSPYLTTPTSTCTRTQHLAQFLHKHCMNTRRLAVGRRRCPQWCPMLKQRSPRRHFQAFKLAQSDLKYPCFLFLHVIFAESASRSLKVSCRLDMSH